MSDSIKNTFFILIIKIGFLSIFLVGCASSNNSNVEVQHIDNVSNFDTAINAYNKTNDIKYLEKADSYAITEKQRAILEKKLVKYLGAKKVFDVQISTTMKEVSAESSASYFTAFKQAYQNNNIIFKIKPKDQLPFRLKYNSYKVFVGLKEYTKYHIKHRDKKYDDEEKEYVENISIGIITLKPSNKYTYKKSIKRKIQTYLKVSNMASGGEKFLKGLKYEPIIDIYDKRNNNKTTIKYRGMIWQNYYPFTKNNEVKFIDVSRPFSEDEAKEYCKNLSIDNGGWRLPKEEQLKILSEAPNDILNSLVGTKNTKGKDLFYGIYFDYKPFSYRLSDKYLKYGGSSYKRNQAIRCIKSAKPLLYDSSTGLEWENVVRTSPPNSVDAQKTCKEKGRGWRLPTEEEYALMQKHNLHFLVKNLKRWGFITSKRGGGSAFICVRKRH